MTLGELAEIATRNYCHVVHGGGKVEVTDSRGTVHAAILDGYIGVFQIMTWRNSTNFSPEISKAVIDFAFSDKLKRLSMRGR